MMMRSIRWRLTLTYIFLVLASLLVLGVYLIRGLEHYFLDNLRSQLLIEARLIGQMAEKNIEMAQSEGAAGFNRFAQPLAETTRVKTETRVTIIDRNGVVWGDSAEAPQSMENHLDRPEIMAALNQGEGWAIHQSRTLGNNMLYVAVPIISSDNIQGFVRLAIPLNEIEATIDRMWQIVLSAAILGLLVAGIIGLILARRATRPIEEMTRSAQQIARGNFVQQRYSTSRDELGSLAESLNYMSANLKQMLAEINAGKTRLESVLVSMVSGVVFVGPAGKVDLINPAALKILSLEKPNSSLNVSSQKFIGQSHTKVIRHYQLSSMIGETMVSRQPRREEIRVLTPTERIIEVQLSPITGPEEQNLGLVVVLHDITELRRLERIRTDFVANVSHELRTPVTSVKGFAETLLEGALDDRPVAEEFIRIIYQEAERLIAIINDLLQLSQIESQPGLMQPEPLEAAAFLKRVASKFGPALQSHEQQLILEPSGAEFRVLADSCRLEQVLDNLIDNAIKYTAPGGTITLMVQDVPSGVQIKVCDTGIGIQPEERKRIFERFYRVDKARSRKVGGTGLGLSIVKHILESHGTTIEVEDGLQKGINRGTCFSFVLEKADINPAEPDGSGEAQ